MADFFGDLFNSFTGQQATPTYNPLLPQQGLEQAYGIAQNLVPQYAALNQALQPVNTGLQLSNENQIYGPQANSLRQGTYQSILDNLNLKGALDPSVAADVTRKLFESGAATGFGASAAGRGNVNLQTGLEQQARYDRARQEALGATNLLPTSHYQYQPTQMPDVSGIYNQLQGANAAQNAFDNQSEQIRQQNFTNLLNTGTKLLGMGAGAFFGGPIGAKIGGNIGGSVFGAPQSGIGGPAYGIGAATGDGSALGGLFA